MKKLNLLPKPLQNELMYEQMYHSVIVAAVLALIILLLGVLVQLGVWAYLERSQVILAADVEKLRKTFDKTESATVKKQIQSMNSEMKDYSKLVAGEPQWSPVLEAVGAAVPDGVKISQFSADSEKSKIDISGFSPTREMVIQLYNNINNDKDHFRDIDYPLENVAKPTNVQFHFTFFIKDGGLVPKQ